MSLKRKAVEITAEGAKKSKSNSSITSFFGQPKSNPAKSSTNPSNPTSSPTAPATEPVKFDKDAWVAKLTPEQKDLLKLEIATLHESVSSLPRRTAHPRY
jgi:uracil-DNA glycosylase